MLTDSLDGQEKGMPVEAGTETTQNEGLEGATQTDEAAEVTTGPALGPAPRYGAEGMLPTSERAVSDAEIEQIARDECWLWAGKFERKHQKDIVNRRGIGAQARDVMGSKALPFETGFSRGWASSQDSALGKLYQDIARKVAERRFEVKTIFSGVIYQWQIVAIDKIFQDYIEESGGKIAPTADDLKKLDPNPNRSAGQVQTEGAQVEVDKYLETKEQGHILIEEKSSADLDRGKARETKRELLRAYAILRNKHPHDQIRVFLSAAYDKDHATGKPWRQDRVLAVFPREELLIGGEFWNTIAGQPGAYEAVQRGLEVAGLINHDMRDRLQKLYDECRDEGIRQEYLEGVRTVDPVPAREALARVGYTAEAEKLDNPHIVVRKRKAHHVQFGMAKKEVKEAKIHWDDVRGYEGPGSADLQAKALERMEQAEHMLRAAHENLKRANREEAGVKRAAKKEKASDATERPLSSWQKVVENGVVESEQPFFKSPWPNRGLSGTVARRNGI